MGRAPDFDLAGALASPSFTPGQKDAPALVELVVGGAEPAAQRAATALARLGATGRAAIDARLAGNGPVGGDTAELGDASTSRLVGVLGLLARAGDGEAQTALVERTRDQHVRVRRAAISALGKLRTDPARDALLARWDASDVTPDERRALVEALGKHGDKAVAAKLSSLDPKDDAELLRRKTRAMLMIERDAGRATESAVRVDRAPAQPFDVLLRCKRGLEPLLVDSLAAHGLAPTKHGDGVLLSRFDRPWAALFESRLWVTASLVVPLVAGSDLGARIERTLGQAAVRAHIDAMTVGPKRYRIGFPAGHRRQLVWQLASRIDWMVNDPHDTTWDILVDDERDIVEITPRKAADPRFAWRVAEVPAASHPTVAAALAHVAGATPTDRVWDPFVGSGAELVERARLGPFTSLTGSDLDADALDAARKNIDAADLDARLLTGDARTFDPGGIELVITNPPLGSRVHVDAAALLASALPHFSRVLVSGGRLVWITPSTKRTSPVAEAAGLRRTRQLAVDLGGVRGNLERWDKP